jgi:hypothetical protein
MKFKGKFQLPSLNLQQFKQKLDIQLRDLLVESAKVWLQAGTSKVPVWSGAARSTFQDLASRVNFAISISPVPHAPDRRGLGRSTGTGDLEIDPKKGFYSFTYTTTLEHLIENETTVSDNPNLKTPTPYNFRQAALEAWRQVAQNASLTDLKITIKGRTYG